MNFESRPCPICACPQRRLLYRQNFQENSVSLLAGYEVVVCKDCGFVYADKIPSQDEFDNYYAVMSKYEFNDKNGVANEDYVGYFKKIFKFLSPYIGNKNAKILDIGCSTGALLSVFKSNGYKNLLGIDPSPSCVKTAKELYNIEASVNNVSNFKTSEKFDLIILSAVLEHLLDFGALLPQIRSLLKDTGLLFVEVPDAERFSLFISTPFQQFSTEHINYFTRRSIENLLKRFYLKLIKIKQNKHKINFITDPDLFILCTKADKKKFEITRDEAGEASIKDYKARCTKISFDIKKTIQEKLDGKNKIIVWGAGTHTLKLIGSGLDLSRILYFVDSNKRYVGKNIKGIAVKQPEDIKEDVPILISTYSYQEEIARQIKEILKLNNEIIKIY